MSIKNKRLKVGDLIIVQGGLIKGQVENKFGIVVSTHRKKRRRWKWAQAIVDGEIKMVVLNPGTENIQGIEKIVHICGRV